MGQHSQQKTESRRRPGVERHVRMRGDAEKQAACEAAVKVHRQHVMEKMGAGSLADLVRLADRLGIPTPKA